MKFLLFLLVLLALGGAWLYRDRILGRAREIASGTATPAEGRPGAAALESARAKIDSLNGWRADSVVLDADEMASLLSNAFPSDVRGQLDSITVRLRDEEVEVSALLSTAHLPRELTGPLAGALRPWERVEAAGPVRVRAPREGEWEIHRFALRDFPLPKDAVPKLVARVFGDAARRGLPLRLPAGVREVRVHSYGVALVGGAPE